MSKLLDEITLPEGRTKRGVSQMLDKEKIKIKKAKDAEGGATTGEGDDDADAKGDGAKTPKAKGGKVSFCPLYSLYFTESDADIVVTAQDRR